MCQGGCGDKFTEDGGSIVMDKNWPQWMKTYNKDCEDHTYGHPSTGTDMRLCCPKDETNNQGTCRICQSCGGSFKLHEGSLMSNQDWSGWARVYSSNCAGTRAQLKAPIKYHTNRPARGFDICCSTQPACTLCVSCGGEWTKETGRMSADKDWPGFFHTRPAQCKGKIGQQKFNPAQLGISLCCKA